MARTLLSMLRCLHESRDGKICRKCAICKAQRRREIAHAKAIAAQYN